MGSNLFVILIGKRQLGSDIGPEISDQAEDTEDMMKIVWVEEAYCWQKANGTKACLLSLLGKEARHVSLFISCYVIIELLNWYRFWIQS